MARDEFYPLYLHDLGAEERRVLVEILVEGKQLRVYEQKQLEARAGFSLRNLIGSRTQRLDHRFRKKRAARAEVPHAKWAFLYNYVMTQFRAICVARGLGTLLQKIGRLHELGEKSGRYRNDMHLFNTEHMYLDSRSAPVDEGYEDDAYVGFRYRSNAVGIVITVMKLREVSGRHVFRAKALDEVINRETRGIAHQVGSYLCLFGFLNDDDGGEFCTLRAEDKEHRVLFGIMTTVNKDGVSHAKQCCFIKLKALYGTGRIKSNVLASKTALADLRRAVDDFFDGRMRVSLENGQPIDLGRYLSPTILEPRNTGVSVEIKGSPL